ncbi:protein zntD-like [Homarus americanus]|uniref:Zinc transporter ZIP3-like 3 n=1 Tax=Homarus americanus TaxID=6706 RepID=A0A8J5K2X2_HOMAM|nr:protein zntD-like [Homarus americanus]KAG7168211.1 Zinc transporter ZIP3-like 3 [Homarus americanus]
MSKMSVFGAKAGALTLMAVVSLLVSLLPLYIRKKLLSRIHGDKSQAILSGCLCFGGGVLMATVFLHLLPETEENYEYAMDAGYMRRISYPIAQLILCSGFFFVYLMEELIHSFFDPDHQQSSTSGSGVLDGCKNETFEGEDCCQRPTESDIQRHNVHTIPHHHHAGNMNNSTSVMEAVVVVAALSFHSIMEGLAIGLEDNITDVWILFGGVSAHKFIIAFSISMELLEVGLTFWPFLASMITFSLASPIGGFIGCLVLSLSTTETGASVLVPNVLQSIAGGTILYVTFCEVLERERTKNTGGWLRLLTLVLGFCVMAGLQCLDKDEEKESCDMTTPETFKAVMDETTF